MGPTCSLKLLQTLKTRMHFLKVGASAGEMVNKLGLQGTYKNMIWHKKINSV